MSVLQQAKTALGTEAVLTVVIDGTDAADAIFTELWSYIDKFERSFSRFLSDSELSKFNMRAGEMVRVSPEFRQLLLTSRMMAEETEGKFNPFILPALQKAGYKQSWVEPSRTGPDFSKRSIASPDELFVNGSKACIPKESALDSGGIGKGFLLERLAELLEARNVKNYWISLGGDILVRGKMESETPWEIDIADALQPEYLAASVIVEDGKTLAIATSGVTKRRGTYKGKSWHHIIDPTTGDPVSTDILSATVCVPSGVKADVFASCIVACGSKGFRKFAEEHAINDVMIQTAGEIEIIGSMIRRTDA